MREFLGRMMRLPLTVSAYLFEMSSKTSRGLERIARESWAGPHGLSEAARREAEPPPLLPQVSMSPPPAQSPAAQQFSVPKTNKERSKMADTNLNDSMVKLVEYTVVSVERGNERVLTGPEMQLIVVTDDLTGNAFSNARVMELSASPKVDAKSVRVYYNVLDRWPKEDLKKDERQVGYLAEIAANTQKIASKTK